MSEITITIDALLKAWSVLQRLGAERLPAKVAYRVAKIAKKVAAELQDFNEQRNKLIEFYGEPMADQPGLFQVREDAKAAYAAEVTELAACTATIPGPAIPLEGLCDVSPAELEALGVLVAEC